MLDLVPRLDSKPFIRSFQRFVGWQSPSYVILDGGNTFVASETQEFVNSLGVEWKINLPLAPRHGDEYCIRVL